MWLEAKSNPGETTVVSWKQLLKDSGAGDDYPGFSADDDYESDGTDDLDRYYMVDLKTGGFYPPSEPSVLQEKKTSIRKSPDGGNDDQNPKPAKKAKRKPSLLEKSLKGLEISDGNEQGEKARKTVENLVENPPNNAAGKIEIERDEQGEKARKKVEKLVKIEEKDGGFEIPKKKNTLLENVIKELEKVVAESSPPSVHLEETKRRIIPQVIKQKLAEVAEASHGKITSELVQRLMSIVGHLMQIRTLKKNLKSMVKTNEVDSDSEKMERKDQKCEALETLKVKKVKRKTEGGLGDGFPMKKRLRVQLPPRGDSVTGSREDEGDITLLSMLKSCNKVKSRKDSNVLPVESSK